jgi:type IV secretory pathway TrbL component
MCLIVTIIMFVFAIQSFMQNQWLAGATQLIIALGFFALLMRNIIAVRNEKQGCSTTGCSITDWFSNLFKKKED